MAGNYYDDPAHGAINEHIYNLIRGGKRTSANELLGDALGAVIAEANPIAGAMYEVGRAALRKNDDDERRS
jgi:hypothetical protein